MRAEAAKIKIIFCIVVPKKNGKPYSLPSYTKKSSGRIRRFMVTVMVSDILLLLQKTIFVKAFYPKIGILSLTT